MSRHRNVRSMNYSDEYDGYDDVYGHSVEDDICMSPSQAAFMYDREGSKGKQKISAFFQNDIAEEENEDIELKESSLSELDRARLLSCLDELKLTVGNVCSRQEMVNVVLTQNFDTEKALNYILQHFHKKDIKLTEKKEKEAEDQSNKNILNTPGQHAAILQTNLIEGASVEESAGTILLKDIDVPIIKVVKPAAKSASVTKGFDLAQKQSDRAIKTPRNQSPASGRVTPVNNAHPLSSDQIDDVRNGKPKEKGVDVVAQYKKERGNSKEHLYMVVIGHVDAGKSTLMGHLLYSLGQVNQKIMHKYEQESRKLGKQSFMYAWVLDETGEERDRGITMDIGRSQFETKSKLVTLLDAPGHKDFIPNMISGACQADVAMLVLDATRGEFETGFDFGGQTREHALLARSLGVVQLAVVINKLETVGWSETRFKEIKQKLVAFLKHAGFKESDLTFVPCSGLSGQNLVEKPTENELLSWYSGPCLMEVIDSFRTPDRPISKPFRFSVNDIFKGTGSSFCVSGRVETGTLSIGERVLVCPSREVALVKLLSIEEVTQQTVFAGDQVSVTLSGIDMQNVSVGYILCDSQNPVQIASRFQVRIVVFNVTVPITKGFQVIIHHQNLMEPAIISKLISQLNKSTGEVLKKHPRFLNNNSSAMVEIQTSRPIALELYSDCKELGRITIRVGGATIAAGLISKVIV